MSQVPEHTALRPKAHIDNGILARVPSQYVGKAQLALPDAALIPEDEIRVEIDAGWLGRVRLTFRKYRYTARRALVRQSHWSCRHAETVALDSGS